MATVPPESDVDLLRPCVRGVGGVHRSRQLCDQHRRRQQVWLSAAVGSSVVERDGHSDPVLFGKTWDRDRAYPAAELQEALLSAHDFVFVGSGGGVGDRDRSGRVSGCGAWTVSVVGPGNARAWVDANGDDAGCGPGVHGWGIPDSGAGPCWLPVVGTRDY